MRGQGRPVLSTVRPGTLGTNNFLFSCGSQERHREEAGRRSKTITHGAYCSRARAS